MGRAVFTPSRQVLELAAEDRDTGENAQLTFSVVAGDQEQKFYMVSHKQEQRGTLRLKKRLDYERHNEQRFNLTLKVLIKAALYYIIELSFLSEGPFTLKPASPCPYTTSPFN